VADDRETTLESSERFQGAKTGIFQRNPGKSTRFQHNSGKSLNLNTTPEKAYFRGVTLETPSVRARPGSIQVDLDGQSSLAAQFCQRISELRWKIASTLWTFSGVMLEKSVISELRWKSQTVLSTFMEREGKS
jgi:hypothetical protein